MGVWKTQIARTTQDSWNIPIFAINSLQLPKMMKMKLLNVVMSH